MKIPSCRLMTAMRVKRFFAPERAARPEACAIPTGPIICRIESFCWMSRPKTVNVRRVMRVDSPTAALKAVGIILSVALLIAPGAIAFLITKRFGRMLAVAVLVAVSCALGGVYLSFFLDSAPAPTIVLLMTGVFIAAFVGVRVKAARVERCLPIS